jgi:transposase InsO family protein
MTTDFCLEAPEGAIRNYGTPEILNTDQGSQFTGTAFVDQMQQHGIQVSMDGKGSWRDNVFVERLWKSVKYEEVYRHAYDSVAEARQGLQRYFVFYNQRRPHSGLAPPRRPPQVAVRGFEFPAERLGAVRLRSAIPCKKRAGRRADRPTPPRPPAGGVNPVMDAVKQMLNP